MAGVDLQPDLQSVQLRLLELKRQAALDLARSSFPNFVLWVNRSYHMTWYHRLIAKKLDEVIRGDCKRLIINMPPRHGKKIANSVNVSTPLGWRKHGDLRPGDFVFGVDGRPTRVVAVSSESLVDMRVHMTDGASIVAHEEHEWRVFDRTCYHWRIFETRHLRPDWSGRARFMLPPIGPIDLPEVTLPLPPYCLGAWLGDGTSSAACITHSEVKQPVIARFEALGFPVSSVNIHATTGVKTTRFGNRRTAFPSPFVGGLQSAGVFRNKHIPDAYKWASISQRLDLLAGLIDTDGCVDSNSRAHYVTCNKRLAHDVAELIRGLGMRAGIAQQEPVLSSSGIQGRQVVYSVGFQPTMKIPTQVVHKEITRLAPKRRIGIRFVERCEPELGRCIQVDRDDGLYLVGEYFTPTHNSELVSRLLPAYALGVNPNLRIISAGYNADLAAGMNRDVQRIIDAPSYAEVFPTTKLATHNARSVSGKALRNADAFEVVDHHGIYRSTGIGGGVTGKGFDIGIIDDPHKDEAEARSPTIRQKIWDWFTNTFMTRKQFGAAVVIPMTRWHTDDLVGRILQRAAEDPKADQWEQICLPAIREDDTHADDPRQIGEALWPEMYPLDDLERQRASMGEVGFAGLYQQRPSVAGGTILKEDRWAFWYRAAIEPPPVLARDENGSLVQCQQERLPAKFDREFQSWDMAFKDTTSADYVVGQVWARLLARLYLLDQVRGRMDFGRTLEALAELSRRWPRARKKLIEDKANGPAVISMARLTIEGLDPVNPDGGKEARAHAASPMQQAGNIFLPHPSEAPWVRAFIQECSQFPKGKFDDQVDAFSQAVNWSYGRRRVRKISVVEGRW